MNLGSTVEQIGRGVRITRPVEVVKLTLDEYLQARYKVTYASLNTRSTMLISRIEAYIDELGVPGKPVNAASAVKAQTTFLQTMLGILSSDSSDALLCWDVLMFLANKNAVNLFNLQKGCQFYHGMAAERQPAFLSLMTLVIETANIRNRAEFLAKSSLTNYLAVLQNDKQRTNLAAYYATNT